jgi:hypothetical protein
MSSALRNQNSHILGRVTTKWKLEPLEHLSEYSYTAFAADANHRNKHEFRVIEYEIWEDGKFTTARLITTLFDCEKYPDKELIDIYISRWDAETSFREVDTSMLKSRLCFKSKTPETTLIEVYSVYIGYFVVRAIMLQASEICEVDVKRMSFTGCLTLLMFLLPLLSFLRRVSSSDNMVRIYATFCTLLGSCYNPENKGRRNKRLKKRRPRRYKERKGYENLKLPTITIKSSCNSPP